MGHIWGRVGVIPGCMGGVHRILGQKVLNTMTVHLHGTLGTYFHTVYYKHNAHQCPLQAQCSPVSTTSTMLTSVHYKHNSHQCPLQAQCSPVSTTSTILTSVHYKHNAHQCPLQAQCSPVSTTSTILTSVHVFSESTLASNSALGIGPAVISTALRREVQVGGIPLHRPLFHIFRASRPPKS